jgi:hypothetical protein
MAESYWPGVTAAEFVEAEARARAAVAELASRGTPARYLESILVPEDEAAFYLFESPSADVIEEVGRRAGIRLARVVRCVRPGSIGPGERREGET